MRKKERPSREKAGRNPGKRGRPMKRKLEGDASPIKTKMIKKVVEEAKDEESDKKDASVISTVLVLDDGMSEGLHMTTSQVHALGCLVCCRECGEAVKINVRPTTKGMISEFTVTCTVCGDNKSTNTPNLVRERKRKRNKGGDRMLQKTENINYAHVAAYLDNGLGYSGLRHYCRYFNARCLNEATFIVYARQVINDVINDTEESLLYAASIVREVFKSQLETDGLIDLTVAYTTTYHQWGSDFCLVAGAVIELTTGLVLDYDVANMYCHVCKINAKKIVSMSPAEMTEWFNKHQDTCEIREWCDELDHDADEGVREIEPKYLECFVAKKIWMRSTEKYGFRYTTLIHETDERIVEELVKSAVYDDIPILIDSSTSCFSRRKSEHARTSFQTKLKAKCPRERVQTKDRISYVYAMSIPEYNKFAISSNIKLRHLVKEMENVVDPLAIDMNLAELEVEKVSEGGHPTMMEVVEENGGEEEEEEEVEQSVAIPVKSMRKKQRKVSRAVEEKARKAEKQYLDLNEEENMKEEDANEEDEAKEDEEEANAEEKANAEEETNAEEEANEEEEANTEEEANGEEEANTDEEASTEEEANEVEAMNEEDGDKEADNGQQVDESVEEEIEESTEAVEQYLKETDPGLKVKEQLSVAKSPIAK